MDENKKYLKFCHKLAYGSGDLGSNFCYSFISSFVLIYLTDTVGLKAGIVGTLMLISRVLDGVTDVASGTIIDRTKHRWGKARFWMIVTTPLVAVSEMLLFAIPETSQTVQYVYFFIIYTVLNDIFYTMNNVSYATLSMLVTTNKNERVQLGAFRFIGTTIAGVLVSSATISLVTAFGGGVKGWRTLGIVYSCLFVVFSFICVLPLREVTDETGSEDAGHAGNLLDNIGYLIKNKYFLEQLAVGILYNGFQNILGCVGVYYMTYLLGDASLLGLFSITMMAMIAGLIMSPFLVNKIGIYKTNLYTMIGVCVLDVLFVGAAMISSLPFMLLCNALRWFLCGPYIGNGSALTAEISTYTLLKDKAHVEASVFSCGSMGIKIGAGVGTAVAGWLLELSGYVGTADTQPASAISMINFMYVWIPLILHIVITLILSVQKVEQANAELKKG